MPLIVPTPDEWVNLDWRKRERAVRNLRGLLRAYGAAVEDAAVDAAQTRYRTPASSRWVEFGEQVREQARRLEREGGAA